MEKKWMLRAKGKIFKYKETKMAVGRKESLHAQIQS
jgi:hypothetical protein